MVLKPASQRMFPPRLPKVGNRFIVSDPVEKAQHFPIPGKMV
jgi:hypothetical protein